MSLLRKQDDRAVAYRTLSLGALLKRGMLELKVQNLDEWMLFNSVRDGVYEKYAQRSEQINQWLEAEKITPHLSKPEQRLLQQPFGTWSEQALTSVGWRVEALGVMLWALHRIDRIPAYDQQFEPEDVIAPLDILNPTIDFIWLATLRPEEELACALDQAEMWNWRSRATELERLGIRPKIGVSFREIIRSTAERAFTNGHIPMPINSDFPAFGKAYHQLDTDEYALTSAIAGERYVSLNWVCELSSEWESISIDGA